MNPLRVILLDPSGSEQLLLNINETKGIILKDLGRLGGTSIKIVYKNGRSETITTHVDITTIRNELTSAN